MMMRCLPQAVGGISQAAASQQSQLSSSQQQQLSTPSGQQSSSAAAANSSHQAATHASDAADAGAQRLQVPKPPVTASVGGGSGGGVTASSLTTGVVDSPSAAIPSPLMAHGLGATGDQNVADASMPTLSPQPLDKKALMLKQEQLAAGGGAVAAAVARDVTAWTLRSGDDPSLLSATVGETELKLGPGIVAVYSNETSSCGDGGSDDSPTTAADSDDNDGGDGASRRQRRRRRRRRREPTLYKTEAINTWLDAQQRSLTTSHCGADGGSGVTVAVPAAESKLKRPLLGTQLYETLPLDDEDCDAKRFCDFETLHQWYVRTAAVAAHARGSCMCVVLR